MRDVADIFSGPSPADLPDDDEEDLRLLAELERVSRALAEKLRHEPGLLREAARLFIKLTAPEQSIHFRSLIWPLARRLAGLPASAGKGGRPRKKSRVETGRPVS